MSLTIVLSNQKGGVGKTTSAYVLSTALKEKGYKVLAVDMDPQGNLSFAMGADTESATIYDVLKGELKPSGSEISPGGYHSLKYPSKRH
jgi:chromosome partitioning protein